ncbi:hypothetical protein GA0070624_0215 [Micromonospora rhizosphaerae]|uniref:Lipoprotein LprG n=1 Tax=Micromonospora rhizosphaerae TaxID=568872 RepID=A0A1C6R9N7_9ACTN|nr:hypothetical protein [Micromonospora rhizosphaerae]SCL13727.1 hypothetical protein GA0070624_0215 [Micromonospora rhizosphaerae]
MTQATGTARTFVRAVGTVAAMLAATALIGGCGPKSDPTAAPRTSPSATPKERLLEAVPDGTEGAFRFTGKDASSALTGRIDPESKAFEINTAMPPDKDGITVKMSFLVIEDRLWMKAKLTGHPGLPKFPNKWMELDRSKLTDSGSVPTFDGADQGNAGPLIEAATSVEEQGPGKYVGFIDVTSGNAAQALEDGEAAALGEVGKKVPFTALVGPDEHLASLTLEIPAAGERKAYQYVVTYADFGSTPKITVPTGSAATKAPAMAYEMLNS